MSSGRQSKKKFRDRVRPMSIEQLESLRVELKTELSDLNRLRNWVGTGSVMERSAQLRTTRKNIARVDTRINELKRMEAEG